MVRLVMAQITLHSGVAASNKRELGLRQPAHLDALMCGLLNRKPWQIDGVVGQPCGFIIEATT
jgi:hypothetical protein